MMEQELIDPSANDPASKAFDRLRREVTTMRLAVEHLADAPGKIEIPDYTETLTQIDGRINATHKALRTLADRPAIALTPETLSQQIAAAGVDVRKVEQQELASARATFIKLSSELSGFVASARTENEQNKWVVSIGGLGLTLGLAVATVLPGPIYRAMPESWHWPEKAAANMLDRDIWEAGERLQAVADHERWKSLSVIDTGSEKGASATKRCYAISQRVKSNTPCSFSIKPYSENTTD